ncbi:hypothetical protein AX14_005814 [Amanita brunnescens Koide BX004]|nr:hypothetical protein AX14_005814 [Amanita brunnescens Koide BX004]
MSRRGRCRQPALQTPYYAERYEVLLKREKAWTRLQPAFTKIVDVNYGSRLVLRTPVAEISSEDKDGGILAVGMVVYEHDLVANVIPDREFTICGLGGLRWKSLFFNSPRENIIRWLSVLESSCNTVNL